MGGDTDKLVSQEETDVPMIDEPDDVHGENLLSSEGPSYIESNGSELPISRSSAKGTLPMSKKRRAQAEKTPRSCLKRLRTFYNDGYRHLLNDTLDEITKKTASDELKPLRTSQIGVTIWSEEEKETFFSTLSSNGKDDLPGIAAKINTKTELEVRVYLQLLQKATTDHHLHDRRQQLLDLSNIPGAFEISKNCCDTLDLAADALGVLQKKREHDLEVKQHGELGLLDTTIAQWVEDSFQEGENGESEVSQVLPAAHLLSLKSYLKLSTHLFMNSNDPDYNWRSYVGRDESPSILHTAFSDFHNLAISVTRRLIQSSLFFAMSRLKATNTSNHMHQRHVRRRDVTAAVNVLGMKQNANSYWAGVSRRCNLDVYENLKRKTFKGEKLSYEEVENRLNQPRKYKVKSGATTTEDGASSPTSVQSPNHENCISTLDFASEDLTDAMTSPYDSNFSYPGRNNQTLTQDCLEQDQDAYAEALDIKASRKEEQRLWNMLGHKVPENTRLEETELPKNPGPVRKTREDLDDWRGWVNYVKEWEAHDIPVSAGEFAANRSRFRNWRHRSISTHSAPTSRLASRDNEDVGDNDIFNNNDDEDGSSEDQMVLEDDERSDVFGTAHDMSPATDVKDYSEKGANQSENQEDVDENDYFTDKEESEKADGGHGKSDIDRNLESALETEDRDLVPLDTRGWGPPDPSDGGLDSESESRAMNSADG